MNKRPRQGYDGYGYGAHHNAERQRTKRQRTERPPRLIRNYGDMATFAEQWNGAKTRLRVEDRTIYTIRWQDPFVHVSDMSTRAPLPGQLDHRVRAVLMLAFAMDRRQQPLRVRMPRLYPPPAVGAPEPHAPFLNAWGFQWSPKCDDHMKMLMDEDLVTDFLHTCWEPLNKDKYRNEVARYLMQTQPQVPPPVQLQPQPASGKRRPSPSAQGPAQGPAGKRART